MMSVFFNRGSAAILLLVAWIYGAQGGILSYNSSSRQLHFACPEADITYGSVMTIDLKRQDGVILANWTQNDLGQTKHERVTILPPSSPHLLEAVLDHVTCFDVMNYTCIVFVDQHNGPPQYVEQHGEFSYEGDVTVPVLRVEPQQARYEVGDTIRLTCAARIGTYSNDIVWETRLPGGSFESVNCDGKDSETELSKSEEVLTDAKLCDVRRTVSVRHTLAADDDTREWRCRLRRTNQEAVFPVAVQCSDGRGCSVPCSGIAAPVAAADTTEMAGKPLKGTISPTPMRKAALLKENQEPEPSQETLLVLVVVIAVLIITIVISVVVMINMMRNRKDSQQPIIITPPPSEYVSYNPTSQSVPSIQSRTLPQPPLDHWSPSSTHVNHYEIEDHRYGGDDTDDEPPPKVDSYNLSLPRESSSVYIPMSAVPSLQEEVGFNIGERTSSAEAGVAAHGRRNGRSESIYSNENTMEKAQMKGSSNSTVTSQDSHVTLSNLKDWEEWNRAAESDGGSY